MKKNQVGQFNALQHARNTNTELENTCQLLSNQLAQMFTDSIALLKDLKTGVVTRDRLIVNDDGWDVLPEDDEPSPTTRAERRRNGKSKQELPEAVTQGVD